MILTISFMLISTTKAISQPPPPTTPPPGIYTQGPHPKPTELTPEPVGTIRFKTINNTNCTIKFAPWFVIRLIGGNGVYTKNFQFELGPNSEGVITNYQLFYNIFELPEPGEGQYYQIDHTGIYLLIDGMAGYMDIYPNQSGQEFQIGGANCNCIRPYFIFTPSMVTLIIDPC
ncbi:MAG: hypothetical protein ACK4K9_05430 [Bacteroidia bacterium]